MTREQIINLIKDLAQSEKFEIAVNKLQEEIWKLDIDDAFISNFARSAIIPEIFEHDSSEEKLYAKYLDILFAKFFKSFGFNVEVLKERQNAPDIVVKYSNENILVVGDAKGSRLSRTAVNPKDLKVAELRKWANDYNSPFACLLFPLIRLPKKSSIYEQVVNNKVLLISFEEASIILKYRNKINAEKIIELINCSDMRLREIDGNILTYSKYLTKKICKIAEITIDEYRETLQNIKKIMQEEIELQVNIFMTEIEKEISEIRRMQQFLNKLKKIVESSSVFKEITKKHFGKYMETYDTIIKHL